MVKYEVMAKDFPAKKGWYGFFFNEPNGYTFRVNFRQGVMWKKKGPNTFVCPQSWARKAGKAYLFYKPDLVAWVRGKDALKQEG